MSPVEYRIVSVVFGPTLPYRARIAVIRPRDKRGVRQTERRRDFEQVGRHTHASLGLWPVTRSAGIGSSYPSAPR
jgi:hypothetical protein